MLHANNYKLLSLFFLIDIFEKIISDDDSIFEGITI